MSDKQLAELKKLNAEMKELKDIFRGILKWIKFGGKLKAIQLFTEELGNDDNRKLMYELSDGRSSPDIASIVKVDDTTVLYYWHKWAEKGMMEICPKYKKRYCKIFSLKELGIEIPDIKKGKVKEKEDSKNEQE